MEIFGLVIVGVYILLVAFVALYSLAQLHLLWTYLKHQFKSITAPVILTFPDVTIQLPIYNELYVVERLIDTVCAIDYPIHKLEIQVIDDSDDETSSLIASKVEFYQKKGYAIKHLRRKTRMDIRLVPYRRLQDRLEENILLFSTLIFYRKAIFYLALFLTLMINKLVLFRHDGGILTLVILF